MSCECHITVQFEVRDAERLKGIATEHAAKLKLLADGEGPESEAFDRDALRMLEYAVEGKGVARGPRGDMFTWGSLGNYSNVDGFMGALSSFWVDLYGEHALFNHTGIVVMFQQGESAVGRIIEISAKRPITTLVVRDLETSFPLFGGYSERPNAMLPRQVAVREVEKQTSSSVEGTSHD